MKKLFQPFSSIWIGLLFFILLMFSQVLPLQTQALAVPSAKTELTANPAQLPPLPYDYGALEPYIDSQTMRLHHDIHHKTYVDKLNQALQKTPDLQSRSVEALLRDLNSIPENIRTQVRNNGGGHLNHTLFWQIMAPNAGDKPTGLLAKAIDDTFGSFDSFKQQFNQAGSDRFGSGWVWLVRTPQGQLQIKTTQNQDNPIAEGLYPILGNDIWEHAYYLKYQNRRPEYLSNWWNVVNWPEVELRFAQTNTSLKTSQP
jgi:Fe-Mn family superoxide dismutase